MTEQDPPRPVRVVDGKGRCWVLSTVEGEQEIACFGSEATVYGTGVCSDGVRTDGELVRPLRPVVAAGEDDVREVRSALMSAGRKAAVTLCAALAAVAELEAETMPPGLRATDVLTRGRPLSWDSRILPILVWEFGFEAPADQVDAGARDRIVRVVGRWVNDPGAYTEVAGTLAGLLGHLVDESGGFATIASDWLLARPDASTFTRYACIRSTDHVPLQ